VIFSAVDRLDRPKEIKNIFQIPAIRSRTTYPEQPISFCCLQIEQCEVQVSHVFSYFFKQVSLLDRGLLRSLFSTATAFDWSGDLSEKVFANAS